MKSIMPAAAVLGWLLAAPAVWAQTGQPQPAAPETPTVLNAKPAAPAAEPYAGQKPVAAPAPAPAATAVPAPVPATPPAAASKAPDDVSPAAKAAKAAAEVKPVPEGPAVKPLAQDAASPAKADAKPESKPDAKADSKPDAATKSELIPTVAKPEPPKPTLLIAIDLTNQKLSVTENGAAKYKWSISSGRTGYVTPRGTFRPVWMSKMWYSRKYDYAPMPHAIFFHGGTAIHGTDSVYALGRPASHGCVRLSPNNAATLYKLVTQHGKQKTQITVFGTPKQAPNVASNREGERGEYRARRYQDEPWWNDDDDDDFPPPARRRAYDDDGYAPSRYYPPRERRYVRESSPYDYDF